MNVKIKYFSTDYPRLEKINQGDWIDLRINSIEDDCEFITLHYKKGDILTFGLGVAMELPEGYEALVVPRSSAFKHYGFIQTNSIGVIDNSYNGDSDEWKIQVIATRDGVIQLFDRICQFRIIKNQPTFEFEEVEFLNEESRGGFGTTGRA